MPSWVKRMAEDEEDEHATFLEYMGSPGATHPCMDAVEALLHSRREIQKCVILTDRSPTHPSHALLLVEPTGVEIVVKSGFKSGYGGTGPKGFSATLALLDWHGVELDEVYVAHDLMGRLGASAMTVADLESIRTARSVRPQRLWDYILEEDETGPDPGNPWIRRERVLPLGMLDKRIAPLARDFWTDPDGVLFRVQRALEEAVKAKAGLTQEEASAGPSKVFQMAFNDGGKLHWPGISSSERGGRANLFVGAVSAYRNPRAHRELGSSMDDALSELMLYNHLFRLEAAAERR
jgi:hypothetical protein